MLSIKFQLNPTYGWEEMSFEECKDGCRGGHLGYQNRMILAILNLCHSDASYQVSAQSDSWFQRRCHLEEMSFEEFPWGHLGYRNGTILAILNLYVTLIPPIKFRLNLTCSGGHLGYQNGTILALLNLHVATMPPTKFQLNLSLEKMLKMWKAMTNNGQQPTA